MPAPYLEEFKRHPILLVRVEGRPVIQVAQGARDRRARAGPVAAEGRRRDRPS